MSVMERKTKKDWAHFMEDTANQYKTVEKITIVMDNLNTHEPGSFYEAFPPNKAKHCGIDSILSIRRSMGAG